MVSENATGLPAMGTDEAADLLAGSLVFGRTDHVAELFSQNRRRPPLVLWSPAQSELFEREIRGFDRVCSEMSDGSECIPDERFEIERLRPFRRSLSLLDCIDQGRDFRYTYYGQAIAEMLERTMQGRLVSEIEGYVGLFFASVFRAAMIRKDRVLSQHEPPHQRFVHNWTRMIVPITDSAGNVIRFVGLSRAENDLRSGLDALSVPCFVADDQGNMLYANQAGLDCMVEGQDGARLPVAQALGTSLDLSVAPDALLDEKRSIVQKVRLPGPAGERFDTATIGGARHSRYACYLISLS